MDAEQQAALQGYLDQMLTGDAAVGEVSTTDRGATANSKVIHISSKQPKTPLQHSGRVKKPTQDLLVCQTAQVAPGYHQTVSEAKPTPAPAAKVANVETISEIALVEPAEEATTGTRPTVVEEPPSVAKARPTWTHKPFECLLFKVSGLLMAVPLTELDSIHPISCDMTSIFDQTGWLMGSQHLSAGEVAVINVSKMIMPERYKGQFLEQFKFILTMKGYHWGLAVDGVGEVITLRPESVRWRTQQGKRPWLAGTLIELKCALVDVHAMARRFIDRDVPGALGS